MNSNKEDNNFNRVKCIYCGTTEDLSESDIIPDALTNAKITNRNVCRKNHNNRFSDMFEAEVIQKLAFITNELDIKSSKSSYYPRYDATIKVADESYNVPRMTSDSGIFCGRKIKSIDSKVLFGPLEEMQKSFSDHGNVELVDINQLEIEKNVKINIEVYFSKAMYRLIAKIAYEWYCLRNGINDKYSEFDEIIDFVENGIGENVVDFISDENLYNIFHTHCQLGSHCLLSYVNKNNEVMVVVDLFGIMLYQVKIGVISEHCKSNCSIQEFMIDGTKEGVDYSSLYELDAILADSFIEIQTSFGICKKPKNCKDLLLSKKVDLYVMGRYLSENNVCETKTLTDMVPLITHNIETLLNTSVLHKKSLKRFVKEHIKPGVPICLNPNGTNKKDIFMFYILYLIGERKNPNLNYNVLKQIIEEDMGIRVDNSYKVNNDVCSQLKEIMLADNGYSETILNGANIVLKWK